MNITTVGIDLAKLVFQVHGVDARGKVALRKQLKRSQVVAFFAQLAPCLIGMEACGGAHFWARKLMEFGHTVKLIAPQFVKPYVKTNKNDAADAEAICEAVGRPNMRFVPIKNTEQQSVLGLHRARQGFVAARTAQANQIRGLLTEFGLVIPAGIRCIERKLPEFPRGCRERIVGRKPSAVCSIIGAFPRARSTGRGAGARNQRLAPRRYGEPASAGDPGDRTTHGKRIGGERRGCESLPQWATVCRLARPRAPPEFLRR